MAEVEVEEALARRSGVDREEVESVAEGTRDGIRVDRRTSGRLLARERRADEAGAGRVEHAAPQHPLPAAGARHVAAHPIIRCTSSAKNIGIEDLRAELARLAAF